jgi:hypothetical protein
MSTVRPEDSGIGGLSAGEWAKRDAMQGKHPLDRLHRLGIQPIQDASPEEKYREVLLIANTLACEVIDLRERVEGLEGFARTLGYNPSTLR